MQVSKPRRRAAVWASGMTLTQDLRDQLRAGGVLVAPLALKCALSSARPDHCILNRRRNSLHPLY